MTQNDNQEREQAALFNSSDSTGEGTETHAHLSTVDENSPDNVQGLDQDWDLQSPLLQQESNNHDPSRESALISTPLDNIESLAGAADVDPWQLLSTTCSYTTSMLFFGLVTGSYLYPWSDTKVRLTMDTVNSFPVDFQVVSN